MTSHSLPPAYDIDLNCAALFLSPRSGRHDFLTRNKTGLSVSLHPSDVGDDTFFSHSAEMYVKPLYIFMKPIHYLKPDIHLAMVSNPSRSQRFFVPSVKCYGCRPHLASYSMVSSLGQSDRGVKLATHLRLSPRLRMSGAIPLLPLFAFMAWAGNNFTFCVTRN